MIGAIIGDIAGSRFEWHNRKTKRFTLMKSKNESRHPCYFTDDTVMTLAVAEAILKWREGGDALYDALSRAAIKSMQEFGRRYPGAGYGGGFRHWLRDDDPQPYNSWGNGSAMRVCENLRYSERPLAWDLGFAGINPPSPEHDCCAARVERLLQCRLCDASKLLTRIVTAVGIETRTTGGDAIVYEVEIDGE